MKFIFILIFFFSFSFLYSQVNTKDTCEFIKYKYPGGVVSSEGHLCNGKPYGLWKSFYPDGKLKSSGNWYNNKLDSLWIFYNPDGSIQTKINYTNGYKNGFEYQYYYKKINDTIIHFIKSETLYLEGKKEGYANLYFYNQKIYKKLHYENNMLESKSFEYDSLGNLICIYEYRKNRLVDKEDINRYDNDNKKHGIWKEFYPNQRVKSEIPFYHGLMNGIAKYYGMNGLLDSAVRYENNNKIIEVENAVTNTEFKIEFYPNLTAKGDSIKKFSGSFINGKPIGIHRFYDSVGVVYKSLLYDENGFLEGSGVVDDEGNKTGKWTFFYSNGTIKAEGNYYNNLKTGKWIYYFLNNKIEQTGDYKNDKFSGKWQWFYFDGKLLRTEYFKNGIPDGEYIEYDTEGNVVLSGLYVDGLKDGKWIEKIGFHYEEGIYKDDLKEGEWIAKNENSFIVFKGSYIQGVPVGEHMYFYENGKIRASEFYTMGRKSGNWFFYDYYGDHVKSLCFENDELVKIDGISIND